MCTSVAPASNAACVLSICCAGVTGTAGLSAVRGTDPVMATAITTGLDIKEHRFHFTLQPNVEHETIPFCPRQQRAAAGGIDAG